MLSLVSACVASVVTFITNLKRTRDTNYRIEQTEHHATLLHQQHLQHQQEHYTQLDHRFQQLEQLLATQSADNLKDTTGVTATGDTFNERNLDDTSAAVGSTVAGAIDETRLLPDYDDTKATGSSLYEISTHMATGAVLGTLMAAIVFSGFK